MSDDEFTPTTEQARHAFIQGSDEDGAGIDFDRWLAQVTAAAKAEQRAETLGVLTGQQRPGTGGQFSNNAAWEVYGRRMAGVIDNLVRWNNLGSTAHEPRDLRA